MSPCAVVCDHVTTLIVDLKDLLLRVLEGQPGKVECDMAPACVRAASVGRDQADDELCPIANHLSPANGLPQHVSESP